MSTLTDVFEELSAEGESSDETVDNPTEGITEQSDQGEVTETDPDLSTTESQDTALDEATQEDEATPEVFDWEAVADQLIPVKVNGEELLVPIREWRDGIMLRKDYSQKTEAVAKDQKLVEWARDVQYAFQNDPEGTLAAFAQAYGVQALAQAQSANEAPEVDPYEDYDPEIASLMKAFDQKLSSVTQHYEQQIAQLAGPLNQITHRDLVSQAQAEMNGLKAQFTEAGLEFDELEVLKLAAANEMSLPQAAAMWYGQNSLTTARTQTQANQTAAQAATQLANQNQGNRQQAKKRASTTQTKQYDASNVSVDDFETLSDLFEIEMAKVS